MDRVSIIVPIFNAEKHLRKCLDSLVNQTYKNIEIILINDGSTDSTKEIISEYQKKHSKIIKVINQENQGIGASRNNGIKISTGKYIGFVDSDDFLELDMYEKMLNTLNKNKADIVICDYLQFSSTKKEIIKVGDKLSFNCTLLNNPKLINGIDYAPWNKVYKKELFNGVQFPIKLKYEDMNTIIKVFDKAKKISKINEPLYNYLINDSGETCSIGKRDFDSIIIIKDIIDYFSKYKDNKEIWLEIEKLSVGKLYYTLTSTMNLNYRKLSKKFAKDMIILFNKNFSGWKKRQLTKYSFLRKIIISNVIPYQLWISFRNPKLIKIVKSNIRKFKNKETFNKIKKINILNDEKSIKLILESNKSVARFGDGELDYAFGNKSQIGFQKSSDKLSKRLKEILESNTSNVILGLPITLKTLSNYNSESKYFWTNYIINNKEKLFPLANNNKTYVNTNFTRFYMDYSRKIGMTKKIKNIKKIWNNRNVIIIEGEQTKLGVGNDFFNNAKSINRIICPSKDAFSKYDLIFEEAKKIDKSKLILIALGPTATVLAYDLGMLGYQAIDVGHVDIEYEWYLKKAKEKTPIEGKFVNEAVGGDNVKEIKNSIYEKSIIKRIL